ncbi:Fusaric acid resistance protein family protein [Paraliobacillus sp. PM-2]|uniref:FUSC family protein n=1 Tax=Paraliobacillus sp. PM-2 TaxID=1462524 RepID=UPI00061BDFCF|nr:FUSC family protein [Paraliobacillus sp. PM-2]CQR47755.1 Fusaric acid resistance protein family protein [Paraliobacillus sp. PM-2]
MKLTKKTIVYNTLLFIGIMAFIFAFSAIFGNENLLIGVSTITAMLMFLERDLTAHPIENTFKLILLNLFIGIAAFLSGFNAWLGIPINFIAMFVTSYLLIFNLKNPLYLPFSLQYIFLLATPVVASEMPLRLTSLVFGAIAIMALQMIVNRNRFKKNGNKKIKDISNALIKKIDQMRKEEDTTEINKQIASDISGLRNMIYDKREDNFYLTKEGRIKLNLSASFEKINLLLTDFKNEEVENEMLDDLRASLTFVNDGINETKTAEELDNSFNQMLGKYNNKEINSLFILRLINNIEFLKENITTIRNLDHSHYNVVEKIEQIPTKFKKLILGNSPRHTTSIKFSYAFRIALAISFSAFIADYFDLSEGRWILFTVLSVIIPIYEKAQKKMQDRIFATFIGAILVTVLFMIFESNIARSILLMLAGYLMNYVKVYRYSTILVTFTAIGGAALVTGKTPFLTIERIVMVIFGIILALLINRFVFPYKVKDSNQNLEDMYDDTISAMFNELKRKIRGETSIDSMMNLLIYTNMIEDRLKLNNQNQHIPWLHHYRLVACTIYEIYQWIDKHEVQQDIIPTMSSYIEEISTLSQEKSLDATFIPKLTEQIKQVHDTESKITWSIILDIATEVQSLRTTSYDLKNEQC